jgi:hypothetical protein
MKKKITALLIVVAITLRTISAVATANLLPPTLNSDGTWSLNTFFRSESFQNRAMILLHESDGFTNEPDSVNLFLPEGVTYTDIKFIEAEFEIDIIPISIIFQNSTNSWQQHNIGSDGMDCNAAARRVCDNLCKFYLTEKNPTATIPIELSENNQFLAVIITDWGENTAGTANARLLDKDMNVIKLSGSTNETSVATPPTAAETPPTTTTETTRIRLAITGLCRICGGYFHYTEYADKPIRDLCNGWGGVCVPRTTVATPGTTIPPTTTITTTTTTSGTTGSSSPTTTTTPLQTTTITTTTSLPEPQSPTILDALEILKQLAGLPNTAPNSSTIHDALEILKFIAGLPNKIGEKS